LISNDKIDDIIKISMNKGAYGAKLLGSGGCGFVLILCDPNIKKQLTDVFKNAILDVGFETDGVKEIKI